MNQQNKYPKYENNWTKYEILRIYLSKLLLKIYDQIDATYLYLYVYTVYYTGI